MSMGTVNGTWQHFVMGMGLVFLDLGINHNIKCSVAIMITIELVQWDILGLYWLDTLHDLFFDALGGVLGFAVFKFIC